MSGRVDTVLVERTIRILVVTDKAEPSAALLAAIGRRASGSQTTRSASLPTAIVPFFGNMPNSFALAVEQRSTHLLSEKPRFIAPS